MDGMNKLISGLVLLIVGIVVIFYIVGGTAGTLTTAAGNISNSGLPLAGLFASNGVVLLVVMAAILLAVIFMALKWAGKGK